MTDEPALVMRHNPAESRYETIVDGRLAESVYLRHGDILTFTHTGVPPELEGQGIASRLVRFSLDDVRAHGWQVVPRCPYVRTFIMRHPEYADLVAPYARHLIERSE